LETKFILFCFFSFLALFGVAENAITKSPSLASAFIENKGQIIDQNNNPNPEVLYVLNTPGMNMQLRWGGFSYDVYQKSVNSDSIQIRRIDFNLVGSNPQCEVLTSGASAGYTNYYTAGTPSEGVTNVHSYKTVTYKDIYPGIDLQFITSNETQFKYNFVVHPGGSIDDIRIRINGPEKVKKIRDGLCFDTDLGNVEESIPSCFFRTDGVDVQVDGKFYKIEKHLYGFRLERPAPEGSVLFIDPVPTRRWGTYFGGTESEATYFHGCITDESGNILIAGETTSTGNIATAGAFQTTLSGSEDAFLAKFSSSGQQLWGTYYGGNSTTQGYSCTIDPSGNIYLCGTTTSTTGVATPGAFQTTLRGTMDAFLAKFNSSGFRIWCTYYGGNETGTQPWDQFSTCCCDTNGNVICSGRTYSPDYISTPGSSQPVYGGGNGDSFLVEFSGSGQRLWATYYGGSGQEGNAMCSISNNGSIFITGVTGSANNISTPGCFQPTLGGNTDAFLASFSPDGTRLWGTYLGGVGPDLGYDCIVDTNDNVYFVGGTMSSTQIATPGAFQQTLSLGNGGFLEKFTSAGTRLWGTYYGASDDLEGLAIDDSGYVFVSGRCFAYDPHNFSPNAYQTVFRGGSDAILAKFDGNGQRIWGTYYGGTSFEYGTACAVDHNDNVYLYGFTSSENNGSPQTSLCTRDPLANFIATPGSHQYEKSVGPSSEAFLVKFADCYSPDTAAQVYGPTGLCENTTGVILYIDPLINATSYHWCVTGNLTITSGQGTNSITVDVGSGLMTDTISVYGINSCDIGFPKIVTKRVYSRPVPSIIGPDTTCTGVSTVYTTMAGQTLYQWMVSPGGTIINGGGAGDNTCTVVWSGINNQWIRVNYTDINGCDGITPVQFNVWVYAGLSVTNTISASLNPVCSGTLVTFMATTANGGGTPSFQWKVNGVNAGTNDSVFSYMPLNGDTVTCVMTSSVLGCLYNNPAISNQVIMVVNPDLPVTVTISPTVNPVCAGVAVNFNALPGNGGSLPQYQWEVNGISVGTNSQTYSYIPLNGDAVRCTMTSDVSCPIGNPATSNTVTMTVNPILPVSVTISPSSNPFCIGTTVTFIAAPTHEGGAPAYQWKVNGGNVGTNSSTYVYVPTSGDLVTCVLNSSEPCVSGNPATSNTITMTANLSLPAGVTITAVPNPFCPGTPVTFTANPSNGGLTPTYQWKVNGVNAGTNSITFTYNPANNDSVRCIMTSNLACVSGSPASSNKIILSGTLAPVVSFNICFDSITTLNAKPIFLKGGIPLGGVYSGPGVNSGTGVFNPALAGTGAKTITYSYTNAALCSASKVKTIIVQASAAFTCGNSLTDIRDNKVYPTVQIGSQCWFASDLNYGTAISSTLSQRDNCLPEKYLNSTSFYQWDELMLYNDTPGLQGLCPPGWHVPTENDWSSLFGNYISNAFAGSPLKYSGYSGFNALLTGASHMNVQWDYQNFAAFYWSSTPHGTYKAWAHGMNDNNPSVSFYPSLRSNAFSVRCLRD
jgi:uncharacterized protein (TIGR02145 family)